MTSATTIAPVRGYAQQHDLGIMESGMAALMTFLEELDAHQSASTTARPLTSFSTAPPIEILDIADVSLAVNIEASSSCSPSNDPSYTSTTTDTDGWESAYQEISADDLVISV